MQLVNHRPKSFVCRNSRKTVAQKKALMALWPKYGLPWQDKTLDFKVIFDNSSKTFLEIGFGMGKSLLQAAVKYPQYNFIGIETHEPGIGALLSGIYQNDLANLKVMQGDIFEAIHAFQTNSLAGVQIFFPDPWQKRRHHARRLIQKTFLELLSLKMQLGASLHIATDWDDYAKSILLTLKSMPHFIAQSSLEPWRSPFRPVVSKFEQRALKEGRTIHEFQFLADKNLSFG